MDFECAMNFQSLAMFKSEFEHHHILNSNSETYSQLVYCTHDALSTK